MEKTLDYYLALPYTIELQYDPEDAWFVRVKELPGCMSQGDTPEEAVAMIKEAMELWLEVALEDGDPIPEPRELDDYSGKFVVRVTRSLHRDLVDAAEEEGVSLNQYINVALGRDVGRPGLSRTKTDDDPTWPGLKESIKRALVVAGYEEDAGALDEQLFADWIDRTLSQVDAALGQEDFRDALNYLDNLAFGFRASAGRSPVIDTLYRTVLFLREQIEVTQRLCQRVGVSEQVVARLTQYAQSSNAAQMVIQEERAAYSERTPGPAPRRQYLEQLLGPQTDRSRW